MKIFPAAFAFAWGLILWPGSLFSNDLKTYQATYEDRLKAITEGHLSKMVLLDIQYERGVNGLKPEFQKEGNLDKVKAVLAEMERFKKEQAMPEPGSSSQPEEILNLQKIYSRQASIMKVDAARALITLSEQYDRALIQFQKTLVQSGKLDQAVTVQEERQRVEQSENLLAAKKIVAEAETGIAPTPKKKPVVLRHHPDAKRFADHWHKVFLKPMPWDEAKKRCEEMGGYLACVETEKERQFLANLANGKVLWLGGSDAKKEGQFVWLNGKRVVVKFGGNQPDRDFIAFSSGGTLNCRRKSGFHDDFLVKRIQGFICEWDR